MQSLNQALKPEAIEFWWIDLDRAAPPGWRTLLSPSEIIRAERLASATLRNRFVSGRLALRQILARTIGANSPASLILDTGVHGKPQLAAADAPAFNLSHSESIGVLTLAPLRTIGVDFELVRSLDHAAELAEQILNRAEIDEWRALIATVRTRALLTAWTRKEACIKAWGVGLGLVDPRHLATGITAVRDIVEPASAQIGSPLELQTLACDQAVLSVASEPNRLPRRMRQFGPPSPAAEWRWF